MRTEEEVAAMAKVSKNIVKRHVAAGASLLIEELKGVDDEHMNDADELWFLVIAMRKHEEACRAEGWVTSEEVGQELIDKYCDRRAKELSQYLPYTAKDFVGDFYKLEKDKDGNVEIVDYHRNHNRMKAGWRDIANSFDIEPEDNENVQYWIVSHEFCKFLISINEIATWLYDIPIWGHNAFYGEGIENLYKDEAIYRFAEYLEAFPGQKNHEYWLNFDKEE